MADLIRSAVLVLCCPQPELKLLMVQRASELAAFPDHWTFPGGKWELQDAEAETLSALPLAADRQTALRETREETGLPLADVALADLQPLGLRVSPPTTSRQFAAQYFLYCSDDVPAPEALSSELQAACWARPADMLARWEQGEIWIPPPVLGVLQALRSGRLDAAILDELQGLANTPETLYRDMSVHPGIEMLPLKTPTLPPATHTNTYLVGRERFVIVDPAPVDTTARQLLRERLESRFRQGHRAEAIVLSHHHADHIGAADLLRDWLGIPVQAHAATAERLQGKLRVDQEVAEGYLWDLGPDPWSSQPWLLEALWTPGHAPGHLCLLDQRHRVALVGDMLAGQGTILIKRPHGDMSQYLASLERLEDLQLRLALPAHGPPIVHPERRCREYIAHRLMREGRIQEALVQGIQDFEALLATVYADIDPRALPLARLSLEAHLHRLKTSGLGEADFPAGAGRA
ncbi:MAG: MBL fold metallo-hydrolase [Candidatus Sericytochromatia bacterium]|nr:MBL fold metallo-hydrolase [Candidatus Sericytochromatia bacterium]